METSPPTTSFSKRLLSVDILKTIAVLLILNHRMQLSYGDMSVLATGGALGCGLFFFLSGYAMAYTKVTTFKEWIQKRLGRLIPTVLVVCFLGGFGAERIFGTTFMWFVHCLVIYFIAFYFIKRYAMQHILPIAGLCFVLYLIYFISFGRDASVLHGEPNMYGRGGSKYFLFFIFYLSGIIFRLREVKPSRFISVAAWGFAPVLLSAEMLLRYLAKAHIITDFAVIFSPVLMIAGIICMTIAATAWDTQVPTSAGYIRRMSAPFFASVAAVSLEAYIGVCIISTPVQKLLLPLFPYNLPLVVIILLLFCYVLRVCTRLCMALVSGKPEQLTLRHICAPY